MTSFNRSDCIRIALCFAVLLLIVITLGSAAPAVAQTITIQNGATLSLSGGGTLDLNSATLNLGTTGVLSESGGGRASGGTVTATRTLNSPSDVNIAGLGFVLSSPQNLGSTTITRGHTPQTGGGNTGIARYYDVTPTNNSALNATISFTYLDAELNGLSESTLELFRSTDGGANWERRGFTSRDATANTVTFGGVDAFSRWTLASSDSPLPVELVDFTATVDAEAVALRWQTASETNNAGFEIQRAEATGAGTTENEAETADRTWTSIGFMEGAGTTEQPQRYQFTDAGVPFGAQALAYRLKQVDTDGAFEYSPVVEVALTLPERFMLEANYPNPFLHATTIRYALPRSEHVRLAVYDALGRMVRVLVDQTQPAGQRAVTFDGSALPSGLYLYRLTAGSNTETRRMVVIR